MAYEKAKAAVDAPATAGGAGAEAAREEPPRPESARVSVYQGYANVSAYYTIHGFRVLIHAKAKLDGDMTDNVFHIARRLRDALMATRWAAKFIAGDVEKALAEIRDMVDNIEVSVELVRHIAKAYNKHDTVYQAEVTILSVNER